MKTNEPCVNDIWKVRDPRRDTYFKIKGFIGQAKPRTLVTCSCNPVGVEIGLDRNMSESRLARCDLIKSDVARGPNGGVTLEQGTPLPLEKPKAFFEPSTSDSVVPPAPPPLREQPADRGAQAMARNAIDAGIDRDFAERNAAR